jgi:two-component system, OmpR family, sensor histidine kinase VicK
MELKDDSKTTFDEAIGFFTYSDSKPSVLFYISILENLWKKTELYQQVKESNKQLRLAYERIWQDYFAKVATKLEIRGSVNY